MIYIDEEENMTTNRYLHNCSIVDEKPFKDVISRTRKKKMQKETNLHKAYSRGRKPPLFEKLFYYYFFRLGLCPTIYCFSFFSINCWFNSSFGPQFWSSLFLITEFWSSIS